MRLSSDTCVSYRCTLFVCLQGPVCKVSAHFLSVPLIFTLLLDPLLSSSPTTICLQKHVSYLCSLSVSRYFFSTVSARLLTFCLFPTLSIDPCLRFPHSFSPSVFRNLSVRSLLPVCLQRLISKVPVYSHFPSHYDC